MRLESTVLSDLSANVFAALLLILLILLQFGAHPHQSSPAGEPRPVEATTDLSSQARTPMRSGELVALFHDRRPTAVGLSLDLTRDGMSVTWKGRLLPENVSPAGLDQILREMSPGDPIRLYVFAQGRYDALARAFSKAGLHWKEVSVPQALRNATRDGWSPRFLQLLDRGLDRDQFRTELARLLAASLDPLTPDGRVGGETGAGHSAATPADRTIPTRVLRWLGLGLGISAILAGLIVVVAVETLVPRSLARYGDI